MSKKNNLIWLWLTLFVIFVDQITKHIAVKHLLLFHPYPVTQCFNLTLLHNYGAAFSFLNFAGGFQRWLFTITTVVICIIILITLNRISHKRYLLTGGLALILGGAIGNLWDRITLGYVIDFIDLYVKTWHWPVFNLADTAVCIGVFLLFIDTVLKK